MPYRKLPKDHEGMLPLMTETDVDEALQAPDDSAAGDTPRTMSPASDQVVPGSDSEDNGTDYGLHMPVSAPDDRLELPRHPPEPGALTEYNVTPDYRKFCASIGLVIVVAAAVLAIYATTAPIIVPVGAPPPNNETAARLGTMLSMRNASVDPCVNMYAYGCGTFNKRMPKGCSLFQQAQVQILRSIPNTTTINRTAPAVLPFYNCIDVAWAPDFTNRTQTAVYLSPIGNDVTTDTLRVVQSLPPDLPQALAARIIESHPYAVYWDGIMSIEEWINTSADAGSGTDPDTANCTAQQQWDKVAGQPTQVLMLEYYDVGATTAATALTNENTTDLALLVAKVRALVVQFLTIELNLAPDDTFVRRAQTLPIRTGLEHRGCPLSMPLADCIASDQHIPRRKRRKQSAPESRHMNLGALPRHIITTELIVNAEFDFVWDLIRVPWGIVQPPMYSVEWPWGLKLATIGFVISHEFGHALDPDLILPAPHSATANTILDTKACVTRGRTTTADEDWADFFGMQVISQIFSPAPPGADPLPYENLYGASGAFRDPRSLLTAWTQLWCDGGSALDDWAEPSPGDVHSLPGFRTNHTLMSSPAFYAVFQCRTQPSTFCGV